MRQLALAPDWYAFLFEFLNGEMTHRPAAKGRITATVDEPREVFSNESCYFLERLFSQLATHTPAAVVDLVTVSETANFRGESKFLHKRVPDGELNR